MKLELSMSDLPSPSGLFEDGILTTSGHRFNMAGGALVFKVQNLDTPAC